jgi:alpha-N-arabinofuranosidase
VNPILPGFHPDPSICRVGDDFYLVTSTFEYFPGLPVHHSHDLVNWRPLGAALDRPEQLDLDGVRSSGGLYAPTIRWHRGVFYLVCTLVDGPRGSGNFVVTATDPAGPWSDPVWLGEPESFDPSLFFDGDEAWFCATRPNPAAAVPGGTEIWVRRFDPQTLALTGPETVIWNGALVDVVWAEAPHLYRTPDGDILLVIAEGGTAHDHAVTCARAEKVEGPYRNNPRNPVLTHRHLGLHHPVVGAGHADLVEAADGSWWAVLLAIRTRWADDGYHYVLGRESWLAEVTWEDGWPVLNPGIGALREDQPGLPADPEARRAPAVGALDVSSSPARDDFDADRLAPAWSYLRTPAPKLLSLTERPGWLALHPQPASLTDVGSPAFIARPQDAWDFTATALLDFTPRTGLDRAGLVLRQNENHSLQLLIRGGQGDSRVAQVIRRSAGQNEIAAEHPVPAGSLRLSVTGSGLDYRFAVNDAELATVDGRVLSTPVSGGFTGTMIGLYAHSADPIRPAPTAYWDWFDYRAS